MDSWNNGSTASSISIGYSTKTIAFFLKNNPDQWVIQAKIKQSNLKQSEVWNIFGEPCKMNEYGVYSIIDGFASCFLCYATYINKKDTGTNSLRNHPCFKKYKLEKTQQETENNTTLQEPTSSTALPSLPTSTFSFNPLTKYGLVVKTTKLNSHEKTKIKEAAVQWLCQSMRPFSIVNDIGLRNVIQQAISLGKTSKLRNYVPYATFEIIL
jgi:hypothetical protein